MNRSAFALVALGMLGAGCTSCFIAGTRVATPQGDRLIEDLRIGDRIWSFDERTKRLVVREVEELFEAPALELLRIEVGGAVIEGVTGEHPFYDEEHGVYRAAREVAVGMRVVLMQAGGDPHVAEVTAVSRYRMHTTVYNLTAGGPQHNYFAEGVLVHNKSFPVPGPPGGFDGDGDGFGQEGDCNDNDNQIHPAAPEICNDKIDNNCDGNVDLQDVGCSVGVDLDWQAAFQGAMSVGDLFVDGAGDPTLIAPTRTDSFLVTVSAADGVEQRRHDLGGPGRVHARAGAVDSTGRIVIVGGAEAGADLGDGPLEWDSGFVVRLDDRGVVEVVFVYADVFMQDVAVAADDSITVVGTMFGDADFGGGLITVSSGQTGFHATFDEAGAHVSSAALGGAGSSWSDRVVLDPASSDAIVLGTYVGEVVIGDTALSTLGNEERAFVARIDAAGDDVWVRDLYLVDEPTHMLRGLSIAVDGSVAVARSDYGYSVIDATGNIAMDRPYDASVSISDVAFDVEGRLYVVGRGTNAWIDEQLVGGEGEPTPFALRYDAAGSTDWLRQFGGRTVSAEWRVYPLDADSIVAAGLFHGEMDFGGEWLEAEDSDAVGLARLTIQ